MEHRGALAGRIALRQPLEGVIHNIVGVGHLIRREVAFEQAPVGAELLDAVVQVFGWSQMVSLVMGNSAS